MKRRNRKLGKKKEKKTDAPKKTRFLFFRNMLLTGVIVAVPVALSLWGAWKLFSILSNWGIKLAKHVPMVSGMPDFVIRILALVALLVVLFFLGVLTKITIGRKLISWAQMLLLKVPLVNFIYSTCKQIGDTILSSKKGNMFQQVVLFEYPRKGCYSIGFMTNENTRENSEVARLLGKDDLISIFMPTTPNPTSGFLMMIPRKECIMLEMSVSEAMRLIVSCGAVLPGSEEKGEDEE